MAIGLCFIENVNVCLRNDCYGMVVSRAFRKNSLIIPPSPNCLLHNLALGCLLAPYLQPSGDFRFAVLDFAAVLGLDDYPRDARVGVFRVVQGNVFCDAGWLVLLGFRSRCCAVGRLVHVECAFDG